MKIVFPYASMPLLVVSDSLPPAGFISEIDIAQDSGDLFSGRLASLTVRKMRVVVGQRMGCAITPMPTSPLIEVVDKDARPRGL